MRASKPTVPIYFRLPEDLDRQLRQLATKQERTVSAQLRHLIREAAERDGCVIGQEQEGVETI